MLQKNNKSKMRQNKNGFLLAQAKIQDSKLLSLFHKRN